MSWLGVLFRCNLTALLLCFLHSPLHASLAPSERQVTLLFTNDVHGGIEPSIDRFGKPVGGLALLSGIAQSIRKGLSGKNAGVLLLDAGDQFQGTLISNFNEGKMVIQAMNLAGYDAAIPGNHDFDFGPIDWQVDTTSDPKLKLEAFAGLAKQEATFPFLSANTFYKKSILGKTGKPLKTEGVGCKTKGQVDWAQAEGPDFLVSHKIFQTAGVRVAVIGIDNQSTPLTTMPENVSELCFANEVESYLRLRTSLDGQADIFVLLVHDGDAQNEQSGTELVEAILKKRSDAVDAVVSGHTHWSYAKTIKRRPSDPAGIPLVQSGSGGKNFGRIDLVYDVKKRAVSEEKTRLVGGAAMYAKSCDKFAAAFCKVENGKLFYEGVETKPDTRIVKLIQKQRQDPKFKDIAEAEMGEALAEIRKDRISESPLANQMADAFREATGADIALVNSSGLRTALPKGSINYEALFAVLPFNNHEVRVGPIKAKELIAVLNKSIRTCGQFGALIPSGVRVRFSRDCDSEANKREGLDNKAILLSVQNSAGEEIYSNGDVLPAHRADQFWLATFDFLAQGGSGFDELGSLAVDKDFGIARDLLAEHFRAKPFKWSAATDGRWEQVKASH